LELDDEEIANLIRQLPVQQVSPEEAYGLPAPWQPAIDSRVAPSLRRHELVELRERLERDHVVAIIGAPKVGKTSLAKLLALDLHNAGAVILDHDFRVPHSHGSLCELIVEKLLDRMKLPVHQLIHENIDTLVEALKRTRAFILLDNFESVLDSQFCLSDPGLAKLLETLLCARSTFRSFVVITTTGAISTQNGTRFPEFRLEGLNRDVAIRHLVENQNYRWTQRQAERIYDIKRGHPHVMHTASVEIKQGIAIGLDFEQAFERLSPEVINLEYAVHYLRFNRSDTAVAETVALHPEGMHVDGIQAIIRSLGIPDSVLPLVTRLHELGALSLVGGGWVKLLPQDQPYVYNRIADKDLMHRSALEWYQRQAKTLPRRPEPGEIENIYDLIFYHAVRARDAKGAWGALFTSTLASTLESAEKLHTLLYLCRQLRDCEGFEKLLPKERGQLFFFLGLTLRQLGELEEADSSLNNAESLFLETGDLVNQAAALAELGLLSRKKGRYGRSELDFYDMALEAIGNRQDTEAKIVRIRVLGRKGQALQREGADPAEVFHCLDLSVQIAREVGDKGVLATRLGILGNAHRELGQRNFPAAIRCYREAVGLAEELQSNPVLVGALRGLGMTYEKSKHFDRALELYLLVFEKTNKADVYGVVDVLGVLAHVHKSLERFSESEDYYRQALELAEQIGNMKAKAEILDELGNLYRTLASRENESLKKEAMLRQAVECNETALRIQMGFEGDPAGLANRHQELARTLSALGKTQEALRHFRTAVQFARAAKRQHLEAWQFRRLGEIFKKLGRSEDMVLCYAEALRLDRREMHHLERTVDQALLKMPSASRAALHLRLGFLREEVETLLGTIS
jgi:tetratricopeptide (TPR) repeat protein